VRDSQSTCDPIGHANSSRRPAEPPPAPDAGAAAARASWHDTAVTEVAVLASAEALHCQRMARRQGGPIVLPPPHPTESTRNLLPYRRVAPQLESSAAQLTATAATVAITAPSDASEASQPLPPATTQQQDKHHHHHTHQDVSTPRTPEYRASTVHDSQVGRRGVVTTTRSPMPPKPAVRRVSEQALTSTINA